MAKLAAEEKGLRRIAKFCERYDIDLAFHNHTQLNATTYDSPLLDIGRHTALRALRAPPARELALSVFLDERQGVLFGVITVEDEAR